MHTADVTHWVTSHGAVGVAAVGGAAIAIGVLIWAFVKGVRFVLAKWDLADIITVLIALAGTIYAGTGTWKFLGKAMGYQTDLKSVLVSVFEGAVVVSGLRARRNIEKFGRPGKDGVGLWVLTCISSVLSASEASTLQEGMGRLIVPLVAAWLWERLLEAKVDEARAKAAADQAAAQFATASRIRWRLSPARVLVWLRLAEATEASLSDIESNRKVVAYLNASDRERRGRALRWPFSAKARAERARIRLTSHALLHHGDPKAIHSALATMMLKEALQRLELATVSESVTSGLTESVGPQGPESAGPAVRESESERVHESAMADGSGSEGPAADPFTGESGLGSGPGSEGPGVRESMGPQGPDSAGPEVRESESVVGDGGAGWPWDMAAAASAGSELDGSEAAGLIPSMRHTVNEAALVAAQTVNGHESQSWPPHWAADVLSPSQRTAAGSAAAGLTESEGPDVRESVSPALPDSVGPWVRESESAGGFGPGPDSPRDGSGSAFGLGSGPGSEGPGVRKSVGPQGPQVPGSGSEVVESDPRWSDETGRLARRIVAENGGRMTRRAFLDAFREQGGRISSDNRSALYNFALAPVVPTEADLDDDTADYPNGIPGLAVRLAGDESEG